MTVSSSRVVGARVRRDSAVARRKAASGRRLALPLRRCPAFVRVPPGLRAGGHSIACDELPGAVAVARPDTAESAATSVRRSAIPDASVGEVCMSGFERSPARRCRAETEGSCDTPASYSAISGFSALSLLIRTVVARYLRFALIRPSTLSRYKYWGRRGSRRGRWGETRVLDQPALPVDPITPRSARRSGPGVGRASPEASAHGT